MITKELINELAMQRINERYPDVYIVDIQISSKNEIQVELDKKEGYISIEECVGVSRNIEHNIDREKHDFELQVSSAGLDSGFKHPFQFIKHIGKVVNVIKKDSQILEGKLCKVDDLTIQLEIEKTLKQNKKKVKEVEQIVLPFDEIKTCKLVISFKSNKNE
ncbi:MAG: ribosome assembly cofactor RimP [Flavobacteriia bacterium]|nr:ribosome assembly cofactor RimP [Flavobacteriia bacterium]